MLKKVEIVVKKNSDFKSLESLQTDYDNFTAESSSL